MWQLAHWGEAEATFDLKDYRHGAPKKLSNESPSLSIQTVELHFFFKALCLLLK